MRCLECGAENVDTNKFCGGCGSRIASEAMVISPGPPDLPPTSWSFWGNDPARTKWAAVERFFWYGMGLPPGGLSFWKFTLYVAVVLTVSLAVLIVWLGPPEPLLALFWAIMILVCALLLYWVYYTHPKR
jgi:hypothetical protein